MVFFSTYKANRWMAKDAFKQQVLSHRAIGEWFLHRSWAGSFMGLCFGDARWFLMIGFGAYYMQRLMHWTKITEDETERVLINRWGGSVESVREQLSPADQARARAYIQAEQYAMAFTPQDMFVHPAGCDLPGPVQLPGAPAHH